MQGWTQVVSHGVPPLGKKRCTVWSPETLLEQSRGERAFTFTLFTTNTCNTAAMCCAHCKHTQTHTQTPSLQLPLYVQHPPCHPPHPTHPTLMHPHLYTAPTSHWARRVALRRLAAAPPAACTANPSAAAPAAFCSFLGQQEGRVKISACIGSPRNVQHHLSNLCLSAAESPQDTQRSAGSTTLCNVHVVQNKHINPPGSSSDVLNLTHANPEHLTH